MQTMKLTCVGIRAETHDVNTYFLASEAPVDFRPGQFLTLRVPVDGTELARCYSLSSVPSDEHLSLTIKRVPGGAVSNLLADTLRTGDEVKALAPAGDFHIDQLGGRPALFLSAGCGITPVYSMLRQLLLSEPDADVHFVHSARSAKDKIFPLELAELARRHPGLKLTTFCDSEGGAGDIAGPISAEHLARFVPDLKQRTALMCGPSGYMDAVAQLLESLGLPPGQLFREVFASRAASAASSAEPAHTLRVGERAVPITAGQTVLDALEAGGVTVFAACRSGVCGSCKCKGEVDKLEHRSTATLSDDDLAAGHFLACSSTVTDDMTVVLP